jgi:predicted DNA-binding transcriptional regulator YafY
MAKLFDRIKDTIQKFKPQLAPIPDAKVEEVEPSEVEPIKRVSYVTEASMMHAIREAAQHRQLIQLLYNNIWRYVEPYSYRQGKQGALFYGHDLTRNGTRSYYIHKIQEIKHTDIPYNPRWFVEIT